MPITAITTVNPTVTLFVNLTPGESQKPPGQRARRTGPRVDHVLTTGYDTNFAFYAISKINFQIQIGLTCSR